MVSGTLQLAIHATSCHRWSAIAAGCVVDSDEVEGVKQDIGMGAAASLGVTMVTTSLPLDVANIGAPVPAKANRYTSSKWSTKCAVNPARRWGLISK
mmetsp:Transcript_101213/g.325202  ORF Transcript_101213/g.325202 Transcript_101213/m.325202 type:complete len:97 (-) Transcript_101213:2929-3219(-)